MNFTVKYPVSEELSVSAAKQLFFNVYLKKKWLIILGFYIIALINFVTSSHEDGDTTIGIAFLVVGTVLTILWCKSYLSFISNAKSAFKTHGDGLMEVSCDGSTLELSSPSATRKIDLSQITKVVETKDFLVLLTDKTPIFCPLKKEFPPEVITWFLKNRLG